MQMEMWSSAAPGNSRSEANLHSCILRAAQSELKCLDRKVAFFFFGIQRSYVRSCDLAAHVYIHTHEASACVEAEQAKVATATAQTIAIVGHAVK